jgi:DNA modification methylase
MIIDSTKAPMTQNHCYTQPFLSVRNVDVLEGFKSIEDKSQDLIIVDPPYYKAINEKWDKQWKTEAEYLDWCKLWFNECVRVLKDTGSFYCYGNFDILSKQKVLIFDKQLNFRQNITLDKGLKSIAGRTSDKLRMFPTASEYLLYFVKQGGYDDRFLMADAFIKTREYLNSELSKSKLTIGDVSKLCGFSEKSNSSSVCFWFTSKYALMIPKIHYEVLQNNTNCFLMNYNQLKQMYNSEKIIYKNSRYNFNLPMATTDVWDFTPDKVRYGHPTQKPQNICQRVVKASSNENDNVLIPFGGSGSEIVACQELKRNCIVFETESQYVEIINKRLNYAPKLF